MILPRDERGDGPALVLLHAGVADRREWAGLLDPLAQGGVRAIALDLPGYGEAHPGPGPEAPWEDVVETLDALDVGRFALAGNSFGAAIAKRVAIACPSRITALVLISAPPESAEPSPELRSVWEAEEEALERGDVEAAVVTIVEAWTLPDAPAVQRRLVAEMQRRALALQEEASGEQADDPLEREPGALARLGLPTLVVVGEHEFADFPDEARRLAAELPGARLETIAGAGHLAPLERPRETCALLLEMAGGG